jgi:hypothetical protein
MFPAALALAALFRAEIAASCEPAASAAHGNLNGTHAIGHLCTQAFKVTFVTSYMDRLLRLADNATLRSELAQFPLAADAEDAVLQEHRAGGVLGLQVHIMFQKLLEDRPPRCEWHACS